MWPNVCLVRRVINKDSYSNEINKYEGCDIERGEGGMSPPGVILSGISHCIARFLTLPHNNNHLNYYFQQ